MDIVGSLLRTQRVTRCNFTVVVHLTKHVEAYALPDQKAVTIARVFVNEYISRFDVLYSIHTNQNAYF